MLGAELFVRSQHVSDSVAGCDVLSCHTYLFIRRQIVIGSCYELKRIYTYKTRYAVCGQIVELLNVKVTSN